MRATHAIALLTTIILLSSCTKESPFFTENMATTMKSTESQYPKQVKARDDTKPETTQLEGDTTVQLQVVSESIDPNTGIYSVTFGSDFDFTNTQPASSQLLDFIEGHGHHSSLSFLVSSYQGYNRAIELHFTVGVQQMSGLELSDSQQIVVEDVVIN